jgi:N-acyl homoserine lactone hydrolase
MKIARLHVCDVTTPESHPSPHTLIRVYAYLVRTSSGVLLFDTGLGPPHEYIDSAFRPQRSSLLALLRNEGVDSEDIEVVVNCHLHFDHCGDNQLLPHSRIVVQRAELEDARKPGYTVPEWVDFEGVRYEVVEGEFSIWKDAHLLPTPGHTRGHQSLVLETPDGPIILAGQAAESALGFEQGTGGWQEGLEEIGATSLAKIVDLSPHRVLFAHDDAEWLPGNSQIS